MSKKVLIVDDNAVERTALIGFLKRDYDILTASCGEEAIDLLYKNAEDISAIVLDILMPGPDGIEVLKKIRKNDAFQKIAIIIVTSLKNDEVRKKAIVCGANGFINNPYERDLLLRSLYNAIRLMETDGMVNTVQRDRLTDLLNRESFFAEAQHTINLHNPGYYVLSCFDIENFKVINDQYGTDKGDAVLKYIADCTNEFTEIINGLSCRFMADKFAVLYPAQLKDTKQMLEMHQRLMNPKCINRKIRIRVGRYIVTDPSISVSAMYDRAALAGATVKGKYDTYIAEYDNSIMENLLLEQKVINEMTDALKNGQFEPWFQPQYNHATGAMIGSEALVRWNKNGQFVPPNDFIPIFERNGFIYQMDQSIWRQVCIHLRKYLDLNKKPLPVSVNISRFDILQPNFMQILCSLVQEYEIPVDLLRLEITESAFAESALAMTNIVKDLIAFGFTVEIDDFGSGYSSLNTLKDVPANILKLDMKFLEDTDESKRGGSILESIVRMAKWLGMSVIAEGVEDKANADFLKSIGCYYIQGYYYAKPMPLKDYEILLEKETKEPKLGRMKKLDTLNNNEFWNPKSMETLIFNSYVGGASIIEYHNGIIEPIRANDRFRQEFGGAILNETALSEMTPEECMDAENLHIMYENIKKAISTNIESTCEVCISGLTSADGPCLYLRCTVRVIAWINERYLLYCVINNITAQRVAEQKERDRNTELLDNLPCGAGLYEYDGQNLLLVFLNRQYYQQIDRNPINYEDINVLETIHPEDRSIILPEINDAIFQNRDAVYDVRILCGDANYKKFHIVVRIKRKNDTKYSLYAFFMPTTDNSLLLQEINKNKREKDRLDFVFKNAAISVWSYNVKTGKIIQNERCKKVHGFDTVITNVPNCLIESGYVHPEFAKEYQVMYQKLKDGEKEAEGVFRVQNAARTGYWFEHIRYAAIIGSNKTPEQYFGISTDVSAEYERENAIHQWMKLISEMQVENNVICEFNLTKNSFVRKQGNLFPDFDFSKTDSFDTYISSWSKQNVHSEDKEKIIEFLNRDTLLAMHLRGVLDGGIDYRAVIKGKTLWCSLSIKFIEYPTDDDIRLIMVHTNIDSRKKGELRLIEESRHDSLTGVLNRKAFEHQVNHAIHTAPKQCHALFMIDLDNFKSVNDNFGHITGDKVLKSTANDLRSLLHSGDLVGRIGGDEFMLFLQNVSGHDNIEQYAQKILNSLYTLVNHEVQISGSLGIAIAPKDGNDFNQLYRAADKAVYYSKQHGKNCATFYSDNFDIMPNCITVKA